VSALDKALLVSEKEINKEIARTVSKNINKSIISSPQGKTSWPLVQKYFGRADSAVRDIVENKGNLTLTNEVGDTVKSTLPRNRMQFAEAVHQTKGMIFEEYNAIQKAAGAKGATINLEPIAKELDHVINSKSLMADKKGIAIIEHAKKQQELLREAGNLTTKDAQEWIARANQQLENFYKNGGSFLDYSVAGVDESIASMMRKAQDAVITSFGGQGYQALKNRYGALREIETGVNKAAFASTKQIGAPNFFDITSGVALSHALFSMNPAYIGTATAMESLNILRRTLKNPDRYVKKMFNDVDKLLEKKPRELPWTKTPPQKTASPDYTGKYTPYNAATKRMVEEIPSAKQIPWQDFTLVGEPSLSHFYRPGRPNEGIIELTREALGKKFQGSVEKVPFEKWYPELNEHLNRRGFGTPNKIEKTTMRDAIDIIKGR
jgi:hypothetical protein